MYVLLTVTSQLTRSYCNFPSPLFLHGSAGLNIVPIVAGTAGGVFLIATFILTVTVVTIILCIKKAQQERSKYCSK